MLWKLQLGQRGTEADIKESHTIFQEQEGSQEQERGPWMEEVPEKRKASLPAFESKQKICLL